MLKKSTEEATIELLAKRSDATVLWLTGAFALVGALMDIISHGITAGTPGSGVGLLWGMWIPLCYLTVPPIHYLARQVQRLKERVEAMEAREVTTQVAGTPGEPTL
jgi:hypothetical protein